MTENETNLEIKIMELADKLIAIEYHTLGYVSFLYRDKSTRRLSGDTLDLGPPLSEETSIPKDENDWMVPHLYKIAVEVSKRVVPNGIFSLLNFIEFEEFRNYTILT